MMWVTWEEVGVDRIGSAWLIRRWIDPEAQFEFVPMGSSVLPPGAIPFDIPGARFSHHGGHCSFHALVTEHGLTDPVLLKLARIIDEADTVVEVETQAIAPGLEVICDGIRTAAGNDALALERGALVYEALYAELSKGRQ